MPDLGTLIGLTSPRNGVDLDADAGSGDERTSARASETLMNAAAKIPLNDPRVAPLAWAMAVIDDRPMLDEDLQAGSAVLLGRLQRARDWLRAAIAAGLIPADPVTDDLPLPGKVPADEIPATVIQAVAEKLRADYDSEHDAGHLRWQDFEAQARELLHVAAGVPATWTPPLRHGNHSPLNIWARQDGRDVMVAVAHSAAHAARLVSLVNGSAPDVSGDLRQRYAEAMQAHYLVIPDTDADGNSPCVCGQWAESEDESWDDHMAEVCAAVWDDEMAALTRRAGAAEDAAHAWEEATAKADEELQQLRAEIARLQALTATCTCPDSYETYAGPEAACPVHGAVRALNEATAELERLRVQHAANVDLIAELDDKRAQAYDDRDEHAHRADRAEAANNRVRNLAGAWLYVQDRKRVAKEILAALDGEETEGGA